MSNNDGQKRKLKFRNYQPYDAKLQKLDVKNKEEEEKTIILPETVDNVHSEPTLDIIKQELLSVVVEDHNILPKKINWDLKLQVADRMEKLARRTQRSIVEILREKLSASGEDGEESDTESSPTLQ